MTNYLPFAQREILELEPAEIKHVRLSSFGVEGSSRVILQDLAVRVFGFNEDYSPDRGGDIDPAPAQASTDEWGWAGGPERTVEYVLMRYGWDGKGYLLEECQPHGEFVNGGRTLSPTWRFIKPYRIDPGQRLRAHGVQGGRAEAQSLFPGGVLFFGKRVKDGRPYHLYATHKVGGRAEKVANNAVLDLNSDNLRCPVDSPLLIYGVSYHMLCDINNMVTTNSALIQVVDPNEREWFKLARVPAGNVVTQRQATEGWIDPPVSLINLGEERGWIQEKDETFIVELENPYTDQGETVDNTLTVSVTLRGSVEVEDA